MTSSEKRVLYTRLSAAAWSRTLKSIDFSNAFRSLGYTWVNNSIIQPSYMKWYKFDRNLIGSVESDVQREHFCSQHNEKIVRVTGKTQLKQITSKDIWKKWRFNLVLLFVSNTIALQTDCFCHELSATVFSFDS